ncbi:MAG: glycosyltransferase family 9 protein [Chlamydiales bacterium]|nr:glycosyltransferase family 9 protein [Chlamydiales bacterium]
MKNKLVVFLLFILKPLLPKPQRSCRCLVISTTGLGDSIWASGVLQAIKEKNSHLQIDLLTSPIGYQIFQHTKLLHRVYTLKNRRFFSFIPLFFALIKNHYESILVFHASQRATFILAKLLRPMHLIGTKGLNKGLDYLFTDLAHFYHVHEIERRYLIAEKLVGPLIRKPLVLSSHPLLKKTIEEKLKQFFAIERLNYIIIQPSAKDRFKYWPLEFFQQLICKLRETYSLPILINGSPDELSYTKQLETTGVYSIAGLFSLREIMQLIKKAKLMITNDTGPMHIAFAYETPTVALFCPTNPLICGPYLSKNYKIIYKQPTCLPCITKKCKDPFCMRQIQPDEILQAAKGLL